MLLAFYQFRMEMINIDKHFIMKRYLFLLFIISMFFNSCQSSQENSKSTDEVQLSFHPEKGIKKEISYEFSIESPSQKAVLNFIIDGEIQVLSSEENNTEIKFSYNEIQLHGFTDTINFDVSASNPDSTQAEGMLYAEPYFICLNHVFLVKYDTKMNRLSEVLLTEKDSLSLKEPSNKIQFFTSLPDSLVKIGATWKNNIELKSGKNHTVSAIFTLNKIENDIAHISFEGDLDGSGEGFGHDFSMKGVVNGSLEVEIKTGLTLKSLMTQDLILIMGGKETPMKFTIKQSLK